MVKTNKIHYYVDMDGVLCNHDLQAQNYRVKMALQPNHDSGINYDISDYQNGFFRTMPPMDDLHLFQDHLQGIDNKRVHILTAVPKRRTSALSVFDEKKEWIEEYLPFIRSHNIHIVFREHKQFFVENQPHGILIDDNHKNVFDWRARGGIGILHKSAMTSIKQSQAVHDALQFLI